MRLVICALVVTASAAALVATSLDAATTRRNRWREREVPAYPVNTFRDHHHVSGEGRPVPAGARVFVSCKVYDPSIPSVSPAGYWYRIASRPWSNRYYAPANTFLNGDPPDGPYSHPVDRRVRRCRK
jgi:hypothetical protein